MKWLNCMVKVVAGLVLVFAIFAPRAYAGRAVSVSGGPWAINEVGLSVAKATTGDTFTVTNVGDETSTVYIKADGETLHPAASVGADAFVLKYDTSGSWSSAITKVDSGIKLVNLTADGTQTFDLQFTAPSSTTASGEQTLTVTLTAGEWDWAPGEPLTISHTVGDVAPSTVEITYGTVVTSLSGASKCWITQNLGATQQATKVDDATAASAGWYWQFNRKQGYSYDGSLFPSWGPTSIDETENYTDTGDNASNWNPALDPCTLLLGTGWRLPTLSEWTAAEGGWGDNWTLPYASVLKLHAAGYLNASAGALGSRGVFGYYWSSTQFSGTDGYLLNFGSTNCGLCGSNKANGFSARCLRD